MAKKEVVDVSRVARRAIVTDALAQEKKVTRRPMLDGATADSFQNFAQRLGVGADNPLSTAGYGYNPVTKIRTTLEWIHRGSWLGGMAIDIVADDMTRAGISLQGSIPPEDALKIDSSITTMGIWGKINDTIKWARLYGGAIGVMLIDGQDMKTPLKLDTVGKGQFKGMVTIDRWFLEPTLNDLVSEPGPDIGLPKFYKVTIGSNVLPGCTIHHSRIIRLVGIKLPYYQALTENMWGISVLERLYDRMIAFDSATTGAAQLIYKAYIRTYKIDGLREIIASGGPALNGLYAFVEMMRRFQGNEGITLIDGKDEFEGQTNQAFSGMADALREFKEQLSGALQIPLVRLFGQSPSGFNSGDADLRLYYDGIAQKQNDELLVGVTRIYRAAALSEGLKLPDDFTLKFNSLWQLTDKEKAEVAESHTRSVTAALDATLISDRTALKELRQSSRITGVFTNITDADIDKADDEIPEPLPMIPGMPGEEGAPTNGQDPADNPKQTHTASGVPKEGSGNDTREAE